MTGENTPKRPYHKPSILLMGIAVLGVVVPFLTWHRTWFGRPLDDREMRSYLADNEHPRKLQHALAQVADRIVQGDRAATRWYPQVVALAKHPIAKVRITCAWVMGQDSQSEPFHQALREQMNDPDVMVRRNAALSLVRFADSSGREELVRVLQPYCVSTPEAGRVETQVSSGSHVGAGSLLARITTDRGSSIEFRSPYSSEAGEVPVRDGARVRPGDRLLCLSPESDQVWEALRGLYFVGQPADLPEVERYGAASDRSAERIRKQAVLTASAIRTRSEPGPTR